MSNMQNSCLGQIGSSRALATDAILCIADSVNFTAIKCFRFLFVYMYFLCWIPMLDICI